MFEAIFKFSTQLPPQIMSVVQEAFDYSRKLEIEVQELRSEIARLKNVPDKPNIKESKNNDEASQSSNSNESSKKIGGSEKGKSRQKKRAIEIHETIIIRPANIPEGAKLKDSKEFTVQDIEI